MSAPTAAAGSTAATAAAVDATGGASQTVAELATTAAAVAATTIPQYAAVGGKYPDFELTSRTVDDGFGFLYMFEQPIQFMHDTIGLPWWGSILATSVLLRAALSVAYFRQQRRGAVFRNIQPQMEEIASRMMAAKQSGDTEGFKKAFQERGALAKKHGVGAGALLIPILLQIPINVGMFMGLRGIASEAHLIPDWASGGLSWAPFLNQPDPTWTLPVLATALTMSSMAINRSFVGLPQAGATAAGQKLVFAAFAGLFSIFVFRFPAALQLYMATTSAAMLAQQAALHSPAFTRFIGMPANWPQPPYQSAVKGAAGFDFMAPFKPLFQAASALMETKSLSKTLAAMETGKYTNIWGVRQPRPPQPPAEVATIGRVATHKAPAPAVTAGSATAAALSAVASAAATSPRTSAPSSDAPQAPHIAALEKVKTQLASGDLKPPSMGDMWEAARLAAAIKKESGGAASDPKKMLAMAEQAMGLVNKMTGGDPTKQAAIMQAAMQAAQAMKGGQGQGGGLPLPAGADLQSMMAQMLGQSQALGAGAGASSPTLPASAASEPPALPSSTSSSSAPSSAGSSLAAASSSASTPAPPAAKPAVQFITRQKPASQAAAASPAASSAPKKPASVSASAGGAKLSPAQERKLMEKLKALKAAEAAKGQGTGSGSGTKA